MICQLTMLQVKYIQFSPRCRKSHLKQQIQYELTCFSTFLATRCLHVANDFRVHSQLSLPICRLSAYTLCILNKALTFSKSFPFPLGFCYGRCSIFYFSHADIKLVILFIYTLSLSSRILSLIKTLYFYSL